MKLKIFFIFLFLIVLNGCNVNFEERREDVITGLTVAIEEAKEEGKYNCCIDPACTMCYLGHWLWKDGSCHCDDMIKNGEDDKVCPECKKGLEEGNCKSSEEEFCEI